MTSYSRGWPLAALAVILSACGAATAAAPPPGASPDGLTQAEMEAIYRARVEGDRARFTEADVRFMTNMIHHHAQAIAMAQMAPSRSTSRSIQTLAARIINAQEDEIEIMQRWLRVRGRAAPELHVTESGVMVHGADHDDVRMPGMVSNAQLRQLEEARGEAFDRFFLTLMIEHHKGAVVMVHELFATDGAGQDEDVFRFASDVQVDQSTEVARMELMLAAMSAGSSSR
jgi:uncharacterized protein (DUF305 family)